jgi:hypothetical protein
MRKLYKQNKLRTFKLYFKYRADSNAVYKPLKLADRWLKFRAKLNNFIVLVKFH